MDGSLVGSPVDIWVDGTVDVTQLYGACRGTLIYGAKYRVTLGYFAGVITLGDGTAGESFGYGPCTGISKGEILAGLCELAVSLGEMVG